MCIVFRWCGYSLQLSYHPDGDFIAYCDCQLGERAGAGQPIFIALPIFSSPFFTPFGFASSCSTSIDFSVVASFRCPAKGMIPTMT
jgi:hypothetical protein